MSYNTTRFFQGAIAGLIIAGLAYIRTPIIITIVSAIGTTLNALDSTSFIYMPIIAGVIWLMIKK